jgi:hypothetical protein
MALLRLLVDEPYLETCCRAALHRVHLSGSAGRPPGLKDGRCLLRLASLGLAGTRADGRFIETKAGIARHAREVLGLPDVD